MADVRKLVQAHHPPGVVGAATGYHCHDRRPARDLPQMAERSRGDRGLVRPLVAKTFPFEQVADAFKMFLETKLLGRITLAWE